MHVNPEYPVEMEYRKILDHGFVALVDVMGDDASIVQSARVSYGKGTKTMRGDKALISYLMRHAHTTPFEMVEFKFLMRLPLFIARQVIRHRTASVNEYSATLFGGPRSVLGAADLGAISDQDTRQPPRAASTQLRKISSRRCRIVRVPAVACALPARGPDRRCSSPSDGHRHLARGVDGRGRTELDVHRELEW